jgi:hypothetical protein
MRFKTTVILCWLLLAGAAFAHSHSSASYTVPSETLGAGGQARTSASYAAIDLISGLVIGETTSATYSLREGFMPQAFPSLAVIVTSISPDSGFNTGRLNARISGSGFRSGAAVKLAATGEADIVATGVTVASTEISCVLDLIAKKSGYWDLVVTNSDGGSGTLPRAFNIKTWGDTSIVLNTPNPFSPPAESTTIMYKLTRDTDVTVAIFNVTADLLWKRDYQAGSNGGKSGDNTIVWTGLTDFNEFASNGGYLIHVVDRSSGRTVARGRIAVIRR